jgi:hypothetical protein
MRMLAEQETSSSVASARPARRIEITAEDGIVARIPIHEIGEAGGLCSLSELARMLQLGMLRRSCGRVDEEMGRGAIMSGVYQAGRKS